ncbi:MAG: WHG domain-containing protein, partial [Xanthomonadales bacterium]|nr:WHG domain-containing protein [Xanthomonadales bacterium]
VKMSEAVALHPGDPTAQIKEAGYCYFNLVMANPQSAQLMFGDILPCDDTYPDLTESGNLAFDRLKSLVEDGQSMGDFKRGDVELMALTFWSCIHGLSLLVAGGHVEATVSSATDNRILIDTVISLMLAGMKSS